jgi:hypothetical protein
MDRLRGQREEHAGKGRGGDSNQIPTKPEASPWLRGDPSNQADSDTATLGARRSATIGRSGG